MALVYMLVFFAVLVGVYYFVCLMQNLGAERVEMAKRNSHQGIKINS